MRFYRKRPDGPYYADARHPKTGKRWQFATGETDLSAATEKSAARIDRLRAAMAQASGAGTPAANPNGSRQAPPPNTLQPKTEVSGGPDAAKPPPASGAGGGTGRLGAALAAMRVPTLAPNAPDAPAPSVAKQKLAKWIGRKGTPVIVGLGEQLVRQGFFVMEKREPAPLDDDEEEGIGEALTEYLATILPDTELDPFGKLCIVFFLAFGGAWLSGTPIPEEKTQPQPAAAVREVA